MIRIVEWQAKMTLGDIKTCFLGVPKEKFKVFKDNGDIYVWVSRDIDRYWYAVEKFFSQYDIEIFHGFTTEKSNDFVKKYLSVFGGTLYKVKDAKIL